MADLCRGSFPCHAPKYCLRVLCNDLYCSDRFPAERPSMKQLKIQKFLAVSMWTYRAEANSRMLSNMFPLSFNRCMELPQNFKSRGKKAGTRYLVLSATWRTNDAIGSFLYTVLHRATLRLFKLKLLKIYYKIVGRFDVDLAKQKLVYTARINEV